jgi:hypothetical protein
MRTIGVGFPRRRMKLCRELRFEATRRILELSLGSRNKSQAKTELEHKHLCGTVA